MDSARFLIPAKSDVAPNLAHVADDTEASRLNHLLSELLGRGFAASTALAALAGSVLAMYAAISGPPSGLVRGAALIAAALAAYAHLLLARSRERESACAERTLTVWRHRGVVLLLASVSAWASQLWQVQAVSASTISVVFLVLIASVGAAAAAIDRLTLFAWLGVSLGVPSALVLAVGPEDAGSAALLLIAFLVATLGLAARVRQLVMRAWQVRQENDLLVAQLRHQVALVEAADHEKSRFLGAASHDLRQPMHAIGLFAGALEKALRGSKHHPNVISMARSIDALEDSFSAMLDVSKLDAGIVQPNLQSFPIRDLFRRLHMHCAGQAEELGLSLRFKPGGKLVTSDPQLLERILSNLVHNALRYTRTGGVVVVVRARNAHTTIEVWDTGVGIANHELPRIFNEFYQVENQGRDRSKGLGMGLSIVKRLVVLLGYELEIKSTRGRGTVFRLLMPATELADMQSMVQGADTMPSMHGEDRTVLVIDDEEPVRSGMRELLQGWGYQVLLAASIAEAQSQVRTHRGVIHIVVSDLRLSDDEDGLQAIAEVRRQYGAPLPAILITGDTSPAEVARAHDGGHPVLFKPVRARDLFAALRQSL